MTLRITLPLVDEEIGQLRALLTQTAAPDSLQSRLIDRIDCEVAEATRPRSRRDLQRRGLLRIGRQT